jgi:hypothetical protein
MGGLLVAVALSFYISLGLEELGLGQNLFQASKLVLGLGGGLKGCSQDGIGTKKSV